MYSDEVMPVQQQDGHGQREFGSWCLKSTPEVALYVAKYPSIIVYALYNNVNLQSIAF